MDTTWREFEFFLRQLRRLSVSKSIRLDEKNFAVSTGCDIESWVYYPERINNIKVVEQVKNFFKEQKVSFMWPLCEGESLAASRKILEASGLLYAGDLTGMIYEAGMAGEPEILEQLELSKIDYRDWARTAWHGFGGEIDEVPEKYFELVRAFDENPNFSLHLHASEDEKIFNGSFMLVDKAEAAGVYYFATIPEARRKGVARYMMKEICRLSRGKKILLQATPMGLPFYKNFGFRELCKIPVYSDSSDVF